MCALNMDGQLHNDLVIVINCDTFGCDNQEKLVVRCWYLTGVLS